MVLAPLLKTFAMTLMRCSQLRNAAERCVYLVCTTATNAITPQRTLEYIHTHRCTHTLARKLHICDI
jgi:hypothetical protein